MPERKYNLSVGELVDKLAINSHKEIFIPEHRETYTKQIDDMVYDLNSIIEEKGAKLSGELIRDIIVLVQMNCWIWSNESNRRNNINGDNDLSLSHSLNGLRCQAYSRISLQLGDRGEYKKDVSVAHPNWVPSGYE